MSVHPLITPRAVDPVTQAKVELAAAHRLAVFHDLEQGIDNHFTVTVPGRDDQYLILPFGLHWSEARASDMIVFDESGKTLEGEGDVELSALSILHMNLARWCDDLMLYNTSEFGMVSFPDRFCGTSSIMMQKKNAYAPQFIKGAAARTVGGLMTAFVVEKDPSSVPILDRAYTDQAIIESFEALMRDVGWVDEFMPVLKLEKELMHARSAEFWCQATEVAGALVRDTGMPWRTAHQIVGILVRLAEERKIRPLDVTTALLDEASVEYRGEPAGLSAESLRASLDPVVAVHRRTLYGGPAPDEVKLRLPEYRSALSQDVEKLRAAQRNVAAGLRQLESAIDALLA